MLKTFLLWTLLLGVLSCSPESENTSSEGGSSSESVSGGSVSEDVSSEEPKDLIIPPKQKQKYAELYRVYVRQSISRYTITVLNSKKLSALVNEDKFAVRGNIYDLPNLNFSNQPFCTVTTSEGRLDAAELKGLTLDVVTSREFIDSKDRRILLLGLNEFGMRLWCTKSHQINSDFTWYDIQVALEGIFRIQERE